MNREGSIFFHFSNRQEALFEFFISQIKLLRPFEPIWIAVPSLGVKNSLKNQLAKDLGVSMGERFFSMQPLIHQLIKTFFPNVYIHSHLELALKIENKISKSTLRNFQSDKKLKPLSDYLMDEKGELDLIKLTALSDHLSSLYVTYSLYGLNIYENLKDHWQGELWRQIFKEGDYYFDPYAILDMDPKPLNSKINLFIYNPHFMPKPYFLLLKKLSSYIKTHCFQFSPSCFFWSDFQTPFEKSNYLSKLIEEKISKEELKQLEVYLESNPLLANNAKLKREWIKVVEEDEHPLEENYLVSNQVIENQDYEPYYDPSRATLTQEDQTLLKSLQTDLLLMVPIKSKLILNEKQSLQIHQASTFQREVEVLYQNLTSLFESEPGIEPKDVVVYSPYPEKYIPYLDFVFNQKESDFKISLFNVPFKTKNSALKAFMLLMDLASHRSSADKLLELFHHKAFKDKFKIDTQMLHLWKQWILEVGVTFGFDQKDQEKKLIEETHQKAFGQLPHWENLIESLLKFACQKDVRNDSLKALSNIDFSEMESINLLAEILHSLKEDLAILSVKKETFTFWANYTKCLFQSYFLFEKEGVQDAQTILSKIETYQTSCNDLKEAYSFKTFFYYLKKDLEDLEKSSLSTNIDSISFYALSNGPLVNSKVICILGLNDLEFPRANEENPLNLLEQFKEKNYCPKLVDYDRYLFLEFLLSARQYLLLSYLGYCSETFKETKGSTLIEELLSYLDERFTFNNSKVSDAILYKHPHLSFSKQYFVHKNYNYENFSLAQSYYTPPPSIEHEGIRETFLAAKNLKCMISHKQNKREILLSHLFALARNPIQFSLNQTHHIYLEQASIAHENQNYATSYLQKAIYKNQLFKGRPIEREEGFPKGVFKDLTNEQLKKEENELETFLKEMSLTKEDFFSVEFRHDTDKVFELKKGHWIVPKIEIEHTGTCYEIVGVIEKISKYGYLSQKEMSQSSFFAEWPKFLVFVYLKNVLPFDLKENWIFSKSKDVKEIRLDNIEGYMKKYLEFYFLSLSHPLPFLPTWISHFCKLSPEQMEKKIDQELSTPYFHNIYAKMLFDDKKPKKEACIRWKELALLLFEKPLLALNVK